MIKWNEERYRFVTQSPAGTVGRYMQTLGTRVESQMKLLATEEGLVRSGRYRASLTARLFSGGRLMLRVGSAVKYARLLEHGSPPHTIRPRRKKALWWTHQERPEWFVPGRPLPYVNHPGSRPYQIVHRAILRVTRGGVAR